MMRSSVAFCLAVSFAMFGFGLSLQCFSCPDGSANCEVKQECNQGEDTCIKLVSEGTIYTECLRYTDCTFRTLAARYPFLSQFTFTCCQTKLCNGKGFMEKLLDKFRS